LVFVEVGNNNKENNQ